METMGSDRDFFDQTLKMIDQGHAFTAVPLIVGHLYSTYNNTKCWISTKSELQGHALFGRLHTDPYIARAYEKPRGYAGDAVLIDFLYDQIVPTPISKTAETLFQITTSFQAGEGVRRRRDYAKQFLTDAVESGKRVCVLASGHLREADELIGRDLSLITAVDQDPLSLDYIRRKYGESINLVNANVIAFLNDSGRKGETFDLIYTLGLTDYLDDRVMTLMHKLMDRVLSPDGTIVLANFLPWHLAIGWMDAVMDWQLTYRTEDDLAKFAEEIGFTANTWTDESGSIAWCEMKR